MPGEISELHPCGILPDVLDDIAKLAGISYMDVEGLFYFLYCGKMSSRRPPRIFRLPSLIPLTT